MKQVLQSARTGQIEVTDVPAPGVLPGCVLVRVAASLLSAGTERAASEFASKSLLQKAHSRPDLVRDVLTKVKRDGLFSAISAIRGRLDQPLELGYSSAGTVIEVGEGITDIKPGDRVACAGAGFAVHAELACVPRLLVARVPAAEIDFDSAAFTTIGAVAIHGVRTADAKLGDVVAVIGLGLLGQLTAQILSAAGCRVIGMDLAPERAQLANRMGALAVTTSEAEFRDLCLQHSSGNGADSVLITAETASSEPVNLAAAVCRDRATVVAVGTVGMELQRKLYYEKEIDFRVSRSYGPGRYDSAFEQKGRDYPIGHVRWTETRNMQAFLELLADGKFNLEPLISHRYDIKDASAAYDLITGKTGKPYLGVLIQYPGGIAMRESRRLEVVYRLTPNSQQNSVRVGLLGTGNYARSVLIPAMKKSAGTELVVVYSSNGARSHACASKFGFTCCTTSEREILSDRVVNTVVIASRHHLHAAQVLRALESGKHVFCEKPLCLTENDLIAIRDQYESTRGECRLIVGFNRRFAPLTQQMKAFLASSSPLTMHYRINAGSLPTDHWINDPEQGGGRVLGEMCHFVDLLSFLCDSSPTSVQAQGISGTAGQDVVASIKFENGSVGTITYICNGDRVYSKERVELFGSGSVAVLEDFRRLELVRHGKKKTARSWFSQDKGHAAGWREFSECIRSGVPSPIPFEEITASTLATIRIAESLRSGIPLTVVPCIPEKALAQVVS
jgi:predicted dehydrogenase/threonine dehydrogenase-like Zn-dependent dehydrogenase